MDKVKLYFGKVKDFFKWFVGTKFAKVAGFILKWLYRTINFIIRQALLILIIYSAIFSVAASRYLRWCGAT